MKEIIVSFFSFFFSHVSSFSNDKIFRGNVRETLIKKYLHFFSSFFFHDARQQSSRNRPCAQVYIKFTRISNWATQYESWKLVEIESSERCKFFVHRPYFEIKNRFLEFNFESNFPRMATSRVKLSPRPLLARKITKLSILEKSKFSCNKIFLFLPSFLLFFNFQSIIFLFQVSQVPAQLSH